jgi:cyclopropane fatty-acyl-phospholipid synthase-like methyltransferase
MNLDLYSKIEPLIEFYEEYDDLHYLYIDILNQYNPSSILDVGCGNGSMLQKLQNSGYKAEGIDLSQRMVDISIQKGLKAECKDIAFVDKKYDAIVAIGDVLNYLTKDQLHSFMQKVESILNDGGIFVADINTKHGFSEVAEGTMVKEFEDRFLSVEAIYEDKVLSTEFIYFEQNDSGYYIKEKTTIKQYFYTQKEIVNLTKLKLINTEKIRMFSNQADKNILLFKK